MKRFAPTSAGVLAALLLLSPIGCALAAPATTSGTLQVFAAASLADAFGDLARRLERSHPGLTVRLDLAGSQQLASQIEQGAAADVFAYADERWMSHVRDHGGLAGEPATFARNALVVIVPATNPARLHRLADLARGGVKLVLGSDAVPVGHYSRTVLANLSHDPVLGPGYTDAVLHNVVSEEENVKSVVGKVQLGEADAGIVYRSDVSPSVARFVRVIEIPAAANAVATYPIAVTAHGRDDEAARAFVDLVRSPEGQAVLVKRGFLPAGDTKP